ncbi:MAG: fructose-bisphosphate aldolase [Candidatus Levybacteria bacterium]|nr:fructose-bisphosphate aldolase [Candidatus Levybacteria bacterium]MBI2421007.1 fructose-bisphosphate aldolase [Candidatus Levybacteria bacterium]
MTDLSKITTDGKAFYLAYDQGMEHGPTDFDDENVDPKEILDIALKTKVNAIILQKGIAENYYSGTEYAQKIPLILKLNGKTNLATGEDPYSPQICTVHEALSLGASAVGYTIYVGSKYEPQMFSEFAKIEEEAHSRQIPVIGWMYIGGSGSIGKDPRDLTAYATRLGLEMGADMVKIKYPGNLENLKWAVESAGKVRVVVSGGKMDKVEDFLEMVRIVMKSGATGMAAGRNIWQNENPTEIAKKTKEIIFS